MVSSVSSPVAVGRRFTMSELVERAGVPAATIHYYLSSGLLPRPVKVASNRFLYDERHAEILRLIRVLRDRRGLSIEMIGRLLPDLVPDLYDKPSKDVFRPQMWDQLLSAALRTHAAPTVQERLVEAGLALFAKHGYGDVSIDDVCRAAEIAKGSFYRHFASKAEFFFAVLDVAAVRAAAAFSSLPVLQIAPRESDAERLATAVEPYLVLFLDAASLAAQRRPGYGRNLRAAIGTLAEALDRPGAAGSQAGEVAAALVLATRRTLDEEASETAISELGALGSARAPRR
jgi:AcrR family transcriptional regulator